MRKVLTGNEAAAIAARLSRVQVISAYPITPQTIVVESLSDFVARGELAAEFIRVESEHSAMSAAIGAAAAGARAFTATSSQGLILMSEMLYVAAGLRLPIVMTNANRSLSAPLSIWCDQQDSMAVRDSGWIQLYCENNQEVLDFTLQAFLIAQRELVPVMVCYDGFILSHTAEPVDVPEQREVDAFLPPHRYPYALDPARPSTIGAVAGPEHYTEFRRQLHEALRGSMAGMSRVDEEFRNRWGRSYGPIERYRSDDAEVVILAMGSLCGSAKDVVDARRDLGEKVGLVKLRSFRPFPSEELAAALGRARAVAVLEKDISLGHAGGLFLDAAASLADVERAPVMLDFVCGLAGRDVTAKDIVRALEEARRAADSGAAGERVRWLGLKEELVK